MIPTLTRRIPPSRHFPKKLRSASFAANSLLCHYYSLLCHEIKTIKYEIQINLKFTQSIGKIPRIPV